MITNEAAEPATKIAGVVKNDNGAVTAVNVTKANADSLIGCRVYAAVYTGEALKAVSVKDITAEDVFTNGAAQIALNTPLELSEGTGLKVFIWDGNMEPKAECYSETK